jgi:DNA-binding response OmpR family regulator
MAQVALGIVEANPLEGQRLAGFFADQDFTVDWHRDGAGLLGRLANRPPHAVLLCAPASDPGATLGLLRELRARSRLPVMVLGSADDISQVLLLEAGADDVVARGLPLRALQARLQAILRRAEWGLASPAQPLQVDGWQLIGDRRQVLRPDGSECLLTTAEFDLVQLLLEQRGRAVSRDAIAATVFHRPFRAEDRTADNLVLRLRRKELWPNLGDGGVRKAAYRGG